MPDQNYNTGDGLTLVETDGVGRVEVNDENLAESSHYDPFDGAGGTELATLITLMRIYDVLLALYGEQDEVAMKDMIGFHAKGKIVGSIPQLAL